MKPLLKLFWGLVLAVSLVRCAPAQIVTTDTYVEFAQRGPANSVATRGAVGSAHTWKVWGFNGSGVFGPLSLSELITGSGYTITPADGTVSTAKLVDGAVTSAKITDGTVVAGDLADGAVTSAKITDGTVVAGDLADGAVTSAKVLDGTIANADISASAAIADTKLGTISTAGKVQDSALSSNVPLKNAANTFSGSQTFEASNVTAPSPMAANVVDLTKSLNTKTISSNVAFTFSGSLTAGRFSELQVLNTAASAVTVTLPANVYDSAGASMVSLITLPAAAAGVPGMAHVALSSDGTRLRIYQGGGGGGTGDALLEGGNAFVGDQSIDGDVAITGSLSADNFSTPGGLSGNLTPESLPATMPARIYETITTQRAMIGAPINAIGNVIVTTNRWTNLAADAATENVTYSGPPGEGTSFGWIARDFVGDTLPTTFTIPNTYSQGAGTNRTSFSVPEGKFVVITVDYLNSTYSMQGETVFISDLPAHATPTGSFLFETHNPTTGASGKSSITELISANAIKTSRTGILRTVYINAAAMIPVTSASAPELVTTRTANIAYDALAFDPTADEAAGFWWTPPSTYNGGTVTAKVHWSSTGGSAAQIVEWEISARAFADDDPIDTAPGTAVAVTDALLATGDVHVTATSGAITIAGTPAANRPTYFQIKRDAQIASDLGADARLLGLTLEYTESSTEPSAQ